MSELPIKRSEGIGQLVGALAAAQGVFGPLVKTHVNTYTGKKYADLADVIAATQSGMSKNGLSLIQVPIRKDDAQEAGVFSILAHSSGEWISVELILPATMKAKDGVTKFDQQSIGSAITYARRYTWQALVGVAAEEDDDGNDATDRTDPRVESPKPKQIKAPEVNRAPAKQDSAATRPNTVREVAPHPVVENALKEAAAAAIVARTNEAGQLGGLGVPKAVIPPEAPVAQSQDEKIKMRFGIEDDPQISSPNQPVSATAEISSSSEQVGGLGVKPSKTEFDAYTARAMALKQPLEKAGLKPSKNLTTGAKLKAFLLSQTGVKELTDLTTIQWDNFFEAVGPAVQADAAKVVAQIEGGNQ